MALPIFTDGRAFVLNNCLIVDAMVRKSSRGYVVLKKMHIFLVVCVFLWKIVAVIKIIVYLCTW